MKNFFGNILGIGLFLIMGIGYINNIIWTIDEWGFLDWFEKAGSIMGMIVPPLGVLLGIIWYNKTLNIKRCCFAI
jgi:hypothetical protein